MDQERLDAFEFLPLAANPFQTVVDHLFAPDFVTVQDETYLGQAEPHTLAGLNDPKPAEVLFAVAPVPRRVSVRHDYPFIFPVT